MKKRQYTYPQIASAICIVIFFFILFLPGFGAVNVRAETAAGTVYDNSSVLKDLQKSTDFNLADYPEQANDYSIYVIQVAESEKGLLYLYTYQPCQNKTPLIATQINMSLAESVTGTQLYDLQQVSTNGVFAKYLVKGVTVNNDPIRYYNITSIYRDWDEKLDGKSENNNTKNGKSFAVRNVYYVVTENGQLHYYRKPTYVVNIIEPYVDFLTYSNNAPGILPPVPTVFAGYDKLDMFDAHYIAFSTDWDIDKLLSADVSYYSKSATAEIGKLFGFVDLPPSAEYGEAHSQKVTLNYDDVFSFEGYGHYVFRKNKYSWNRIQSVAEFISTEEYLTDETKANLQGKQWVLRFAETERTQKELNLAVYHSYQLDWTVVDRVTILRLEFETDGVIYNLGAVSDIVSGDNLPGNHDVAEPKTFWTWLAGLLGVSQRTAKIITIIVLCLLALIIFFPILSPFLGIIAQGIAWLIKGIAKLISLLIRGAIWIITLPFRFIAKLFNGKSGTDNTPPKPTKGRPDTAGKPNKKQTAKKRGQHAEN